MIHLIYVSSADHDMSERELMALLEKARHFNRQHGITGMLLYIGGNFMQVLEGEEEVVDKLYADINKDHRHKHCTLILREDIDQRTFPDWSMGFRSLGGDEKEIEAYSDFLKQAVKPEQFAGADVAWGLLRRFRDTNS